MASLNVAPSRSDITRKLKLATVGYLTKKGYAVNLELGLIRRGRLKADVVGMRLDATLVIVEIKSGPQDLASDKKWEKYRPYCNYFYLGITDSHWQTIDRSLDIGMLVLNPVTGYMMVKKRARRNKMDGKLKRQMVIRMAYRGAAYTKRSHRRQRVFLHER